MYDYFLIVKEKFFYSSLEDLILRKIVSIKLIIDGMMLVHFLECLVLLFFFIISSVRNIHSLCEFIKNLIQSIIIYFVV